MNFTNRWQKQNTSIQLKSLLAILVTLHASAFFVHLIGFSSHWLGIAFIGCLLVVVCIVMFKLQKRYTNSLVRMMAHEFDDLEFAIRTVFKDNHIRFRRQKEDGLHIFEIPARSLTVVLRPVVRNSDAFNHYLKMRPVTEIRLSGLNKRNRDAAYQLAASIDQVTI